MSTFKAWIVCGLAAGFIAGCGGGGSREFDSNSSGGTPGAATPASVELTKSAPSITSDGRQRVRLFATVKDAGNVVLADVPVSFSASGQGVSVTALRPATDSSGQVEATLTVNDQTNRSISVTAVAAGKSASTELLVVGSTVSVSGPASVVLGTPAVFQVFVQDASGAAIVGKAVEATSAVGNAVALAARETDSQGVVNLVYTPSRAGADTIAVRAAGASGERQLQVSTTSVAFDSPSALAEIVVDSPAVPVRVRILESGVPPSPPVIVTFAATRGLLGPASASTDAAGYASTTLRSPNAGRSTITATVPNGTVATRDVLFVADRAAKLEVQASPTTVGINISGGTTESSQIIAVVRDLADNPVKGARVNFSVTDPSAGAGLSAGFAVTDASGRATVTFYPGAIPTGTNKIVVRGAIDCAYVVTGVQCAAPGNPPSDQIELTAARRALQVRIGTGNELVKVEEPGSAPVFNEMPYGVVVTDSAGNPVAGVSLNATVFSLNYGKGYWSPVPLCQIGSQVCWNQIVEDVCASEDLNENLLLDKVPVNEDVNGDEVLTPGNVAAAYFGATGLATTAVTDDKGSSVLRIRYLRDRSAWVKVRVRITASVPDGTEGAEKVEFWLPMLASDVVSPTVSPPGVVSPYKRGSCP